MVQVSALKLEEVKLIRLSAHRDNRGFFMETYKQSLYQEHIPCTFVQDNYSFSKKGVIRGLHFQSTPGQAKLVSVIVGTIYDVFVDIRPASPTFGQWGGYLLDAEAHEQLFIPVGFAHGFAVLSETAHVFYKVSTPFNAATEKSIRYNDPAIGVEWPISEPVLSEKDRSAPLLQEVLV